MSLCLLKKIFDSLCYALRRLYESDSDLIAVGVNERCMAAHIFHCVKLYWEEHHDAYEFDVDAEYNRDNDYPKKLLCKYQSDANPCIHEVIPDLIIHERRLRRNICVIEFKKDGRNGQDDIEKLREFTRQDSDGNFKYQLGLYIVLAATYDDVQIQIVVDGEERGGPRKPTQVKEMISVVAQQKQWR